MLIIIISIIIIIISSSSSSSSSSISIIIIIIIISIIIITVQCEPSPPMDVFQSALISLPFFPTCHSAVIHTCLYIIPKFESPIIMAPKLLT